MSIEQITQFIERLDVAKISYDLASYRSDALAVSIAVPGERWEVEFLTDGEVQVEVFRSDGTISDAAAIEDLFERFSE